MFLGKKILVFPPAFKMKNEVVQIKDGYLIFEKMNIKRLYITNDNRIRAEVDQTRLILQFTLQVFKGIKALQFKLKAILPVDGVSSTYLSFDDYQKGYFKPLFKFEDFDINMDNFEQFEIKSN